MTAAAADKKPEEGEKPVVAGELLYCGGTQFDTMGHKTPASSSNLVSPTRLRPLVGVDIRFVASGCTACHCLALDVDGRCFTWGRNEKGQLGHGDTLQRNLPMIVSKLSARENGKVNASSKPSKKPAPKSPANSNKRKKDSSESEADEDDSSVESDGKKPKRGGKSAGRGQGRGAKKGNDSTPKRGRGCPKSSEEEISSGRGRGRGNSGKTAKSRK